MCVNCGAEWETTINARDQLLAGHGFVSIRLRCCRHHDGWNDGDTQLYWKIKSPSIDPWGTPLSIHCSPYWKPLTTPSETLATKKWPQTWSNKQRVVSTNIGIGHWKHHTVKLYTMSSASIKLCAAMQLWQRAWHLLTTSPSLTQPDLFFQSLHDS